MKETPSLHRITIAVVMLLMHSVWAQQQPNANGTVVGVRALKTPQLHSKVVVRRDERDVPYIEATNVRDMYFVQGFVTASDRLWQMDLLRRTAAGELSEIFGSPTLKDDKQMRAFGFSHLTEQMVARLPLPVRASLEAYAEGVNAYLRSVNDNNLPLEFKALHYKPRPWRPADSLIIGKLFAQTLSTSWQTDMMRQAFANVPQDRLQELLPSKSPLDIVLVGSDKPPSSRVNRSNPVPRMNGNITADTLGAVSRISEISNRLLARTGLFAEDLAASNSWVVSGRRTLSGKPLLANDPHLRVAAPCIWYMTELSAPGFHVAGVTIAGEPGVLIGHNNWIAWGITNVEADVQDVYVERVDQANQSRYLAPDGWRKVESRREEIKVRKSPIDSATDTVFADIMVTRHGPVVLQKDGQSYTVAWPTLDPTSNEFDVYFHINRAHDWTEFRNALKTYTGFPLNFIYADARDHIGYWAAGRYPIRRSGDGTIPYDGATDAGDWTGYVPFEATPHLIDPPSGILVTANNRIVGTDYPYYITYDWEPPYRARRIYSLLTAKRKLSVEDFRNIQADTYSYPDATLVAALLKADDPPQNEPKWREMVSMLRENDAMMNPDSRAIALSFSMRQALLRRLLIANVGDDLAKRYAWAGSGTFLDRIITTQPREWLPKEFESYQALFLAAYEDALGSMTKELGPDRSQWTWGHLTHVHFVHPLAALPSIGQKFAIDPIPQSGGNYTINRGGLVSMRYIADLSNWNNTRLGIPLGESGDPRSPYWKDQFKDWQAVNPSKFAFSNNAVSRATRDLLILRP